MCKDKDIRKVGGYRMNRKSRYIPLPDRIISLAEIVNAQADEPSIDYDPYMIGLFNGLEMGLAIMESREPVFMRVPQKRNIRSFIDKFIVKKFKPMGSEVN